MIKKLLKFIDLLLFFFVFIFIFKIIFLNERMEQLLFFLLLKMGKHKLFNFYWKKEEQILIFQLRFFLVFFYF